MSHYRIDYQKDKKALISIINAALNLKLPFDKKIQQILIKNPSHNNHIFSKGEVLSAFKYYQKSNIIKLSPFHTKKFLARMQMKKTRTISGVTPVAVFTKPYPCPGECIFCPSDTRQPKSYISNEPGAQRATRNFFDPYLQVYNRLTALSNIGHPTDKAELIILGGTWSAYPKKYQIWFIKRCFDALNDFDSQTQTEKKDDNLSLPYHLNISDSKNTSYNQAVLQALKKNSQESASWDELCEVHKKNEKVKNRCVGLTIETRPNEINRNEIINLRKLGVTKVQLGIQSLNNKVLKKNKRGHTAQKSRDVINLLRLAGLKVMIHWMPNLYGSNPEKDVIDFRKVFSDTSVRPDEMKIYPCSLIQTAELMNYYEKKLWKPYSHKQLLFVLKECFRITPRYCRISRMIRDIPSDNIVAGNKKTNFRQIVEKNLSQEGVRLSEIRAREIKNKKITSKSYQLQATSYKTKVTNEYFLEFIDSEDNLAGFLRLSLPTQKPYIQELERSAIIREVHIYGPAQEIGKRRIEKTQHTGLGKKLIKKAQEISVNKNFSKLSVISAIGTREYYRKLGFKDGKLYQHLILVNK